MSLIGYTRLGGQMQSARLLCMTCKSVLLHKWEQNIFSVGYYCTFPNRFWAAQFISKDLKSGSRICWGSETMALRRIKDGNLSDLFNPFKKKNQFVANLTKIEVLLESWGVINNRKVESPPKNCLTLIAFRTLLIKDWHKTNSFTNCSLFAAIYPRDKSLIYKSFKSSSDWFTALIFWKNKVVFDFCNNKKLI